ncbi:hypothetical protein A1O3_07599, partial [Capronia epimyces CBS 606.96]
PSTSSSPSSSSPMISNPPKRIVIRRPSPGLDLMFHKCLSGRPAPPRMFAKPVPLKPYGFEKGFEMVRPSPEMKPYRMRERRLVGGRAKAAKVPKFLVAPIPKLESSIKKMEILEELIKDSAERKRLEK